MSQKEKAIKKKEMVINKIENSIKEYEDMLKENDFNSDAERNNAKKILRSLK
jgi:Na+/phosphate symporter